MSKKHKKHRIVVNVLDLASAGKAKVMPHVHKHRWIIFPILGLAAIAAFGVWFNRAYSDTFYPGVKIADTYVGGKTLEEITAHYAQEAKILADTGIHLTLLDSSTTKEVTIPMSIQGLTPDNSFEYFTIGDWQPIIAEAYAYGRTGPWWQRGLEQASLVLGKRFIFPSTIYQESVRSLLEREFELFLKETKSAEYVVDKNGIVTISPEIIGESIDIDEVTGLLAYKIATLDATPERLQATVETPLATEAALAPFLPLVEEMVKSTKLVFHYKERSWTVSGATLATWLTIKNKDTIGIDRAKLKKYISGTVALVINDPPVNSRFAMQNGKLVEIVAGRAGSVVDIDATAETVERMIPDLERSFAARPGMAAVIAALTTEASYDPTTGTIDIPVVVVQKEPIVTKKTIDDYGITELVGSSRTSFKGSSADRITNITVGSATLNGFLIAPGQEFSAVDTIGYVNEENGYKKEYVIKDNRSIKEFGGGLCQLATTLFRLALNAGLPITERAAHRYVVGYYGPGLDATIYGPHPDLRFLNDTGKYLLMQARVEGTDLVMELYGQKDGRQVSIGEPVITDRIPAAATKYIYTTELAPSVQQCSETPREGMTTDATYRVAYRSGKINEQHFKSIYQPWGKICLIGAPR